MKAVITITFQKGDTKYKVSSSIKLDGADPDKYSVFDFLDEFGDQPLSELVDISGVENSQMILDCMRRRGATMDEMVQAQNGENLAYFRRKYGV